MQLIEAFKLALQSLWANKMRSILTLIGVVMGVASVIMVITLVNGANRYVSTKLSGYGADVFTLTRTSSVIFTPEDAPSGVFWPGLCQCRHRLFSGSARMLGL